MLYGVIGLVMSLSALYMKRKSAKGGYGSIERHSHAMTVMPMIHGFIAGWGIGAFAVILYGVLSPSMPSGYVAWIPGALFGFGTMVTQMLIGTIFGAFIERLKIGEAQKARFASKVSSTTLFSSGIAFMVVGLLGVIFPSEVASVGISTPVNVPNLARIDVGFFLAVPVVFVSAALAMYFGYKELRDSNEGNFTKAQVSQ